MSKINTLFPYYGGKHHIANDLVDYILVAKSKANANTYVEPYLGGGRTYINLMDNKFEKFVLNELNYPLFALWMCLLDIRVLDTFITRAKAIPTDKETFERIKAILNDEALVKSYDYITVGAYKYYMLKNSWNASEKVFFARGDFIESCDKLFNRVMKIPESNFYLYNKDGLKVIEEYCSDEKAVLLLDPPYWIKELVNKKPYIECEAVSTEYHQKLIDLLCSDRCKAKVILCGYYKETEEAKQGEHIYDKLNEHGFTRVAVQTVTKSSSPQKATATEVIWKNF